jgi:transketolase
MTDMEKAFIKMLDLKMTELRLSILEQAFLAVDQGVHIGGAFSALLPLTALYYGGLIHIDVQNPTRPGQDIFILSKGHAVAALASIYADLGYFPAELLKNSRSVGSLLNGHPGPILPGVQVSTGPLGQGIGVAGGFALQGKQEPRFDVYCMTGDGELQEGMVWEAVMFAGCRHLDNLCVLVDANDGQLDDPGKLILSAGDVKVRFESFGWNAVDISARELAPVLHALAEFKKNAGTGKPTALICHSVKGFGGYAAETGKHKITLSEPLYRQERICHQDEYTKKEKALGDALSVLDGATFAAAVRDAEAMRLNIRKTGSEIHIEKIPAVCRMKKAPVREKKMCYNESALPVIEANKEYLPGDIIRDTIRTLAQDARIVSIDSDLSTTSGLAAGVGAIDKNRALNVGIAEANMMNIAESFAAAGCNVWTSTFCPFFNWQVMRRIAVSQQERNEDIASGGGWLNTGHGLDITFVATAADLETATNGATHMGNDDIMVMDTVADVKIITASCPRQLLSIMQWIAEGNRGLVYLRVLRAATKVIYPSDYCFQYGAAQVLKEGTDTVLVSYGRGIYECLKAHEKLAAKGINCTVVDMPCFDGDTLAGYYNNGRTIIIIEQNNGYAWQHMLRYFAQQGLPIDTKRIHAVNTLDSAGRAQFIHSGTYAQLAKKYGLDADAIAESIERIRNY